MDKKTFNRLILQSSIVSLFSKGARRQKKKTWKIVDRVESLGYYNRAANHDARIAISLVHV